MTHENNNIGGRAEHPGSDEQKISRLLRDLKRVEAPKDFDFHLKARLANARPGDYQRTSLLPILKYAMPLGLFLAVGVGMLFYSSYSSRVTIEMVQEPVGAASPEPQPATASAPISQPTNVLPEAPGTMASSDEETPHRKPGSEIPRLASKPETPSGGSRDFREAIPPGNSADFTVSGAPTPRTPRGMSSLNPMGVSEALRLIDAEASFENNAWVVKSVRANGIAAQMGLKAGDRLKSIDGKPVGEKTEFQRSFSAGTIQVQRGDATVELGSANKLN